MSSSAYQPSLQQDSQVSEYQLYKKENPNYHPYCLNNLFLNDVVQYKCSCSSYRRFSSTYFCRHCMALRCRNCVSHEVDSQYCQHCLEYIPTIDPKFQKNKCASCYQCPSCQHLLTTIVLAVTGQPQSPTIQPQQADQTSAQKITLQRLSQLVCVFCRWSSKTFTVTDGTRTTKDLAEVEVPNIKRIGELMSYYSSMSQKEKADKDKKRFHSRSGNTMDLLKKYGITKTLSPKLFESLRTRSTLHEKSSTKSKYDLDSSLTTKDETAIDELEQSVGQTHDQIEPLDTFYFYDKNFNFEEISRLEQRLAQVEVQPFKISEFKPISKSLSVKRSLRCKECERNLCRSEYSPVSIKFKIQSAAYYHIPELKIRSQTYPIKLKLNSISNLEFTIQNQTSNNVNVKIEKIDGNCPENMAYELTFPPNEMHLGPKDDTADYDFLPPKITPASEDDHILFQKLNKIGFFIKVKPLKAVEDLAIEFKMSHDVVVLQGPREADRTERVCQRLRVCLGPVYNDRDSC